MSRTRLMLRWISRTSLSWPITFSQRPRQLNCELTFSTLFLGTHDQHRHFPTKRHVRIGSSSGRNLQDIQCKSAFLIPVAKLIGQCTKSVAIDNKDLRTQAVPRPIAGADKPVPPTPRIEGGKRRATVLAEDRRQSTAPVSA
jgi:hypothetical protein